MEVYEAIPARHSVRSYRDRAVEPAKLARVLEAARLAPSARNEQEWRFVVVSDLPKREALATQASTQAFMLEAPLIIAACAQTDGRVMRCGQLAYPIDVAIALDPAATKYGAVQSFEDARKCADLFRAHRDEIDGVLVTLPNFGEERPISDTIRWSELGVPVLVHAFNDVVNLGHFYVPCLRVKLGSNYLALFAIIPFIGSRNSRLNGF